MNKHYLNHFFEPEVIAVIGSSEQSGSEEARLYERLKQQFKGKVWFVHPRPHRSLLGSKGYQTIDQLPGKVDLAIIMTEDARVEEQLRRCATAGVDSVVVLSSLDSQVGYMKQHFIDHLRKTADRLNVKIWGPDCYGFVRPTLGIRATLDPVEVKAGKIALISHSGAICRAITDWAESTGVGFSTIISLEQASGVYLGDILDYLVWDTHTDCILVYAEGVKDARSFLSGLRGVARSKPVIVLKSGRFSESLSSDLSHTGALVGSDTVFNAVLERAGIVRADSLTDLFLAARAFPIHKSVRGDRIAVVSHGLGPAMMACDRAKDLSIPLAALGNESKAQLATLQSIQAHENPVYSSGFGVEKEFIEACETLCRDKNVDFLVAIITPPKGKVVEELEVHLQRIQAATFKPIVVCCMGGEKLASLKKRIQMRGIPVFSSPENAIKAVKYLTTYYKNRTFLIQAPSAMENQAAPDIEGAKLIIEGVLQEGRKRLDQMESRAILKAFSIPINATWNTRSANEALVAAESVGFPVVLKINSPDISHKSDVAGVSLNVMNAQAVRSAYKKLLDDVAANLPDAQIDGVFVEHMVQNTANRELLLAIKHDDVFGPVIAFGHGGSMVDIIDDIAISLPPINSVLATSLVNSPKVSAMLDRYRNLPAVNREQLENVILRLSALACELPWVKNLEINPLIANDEGVLVLDAVVEVDYPEPALSSYGHMAIHPYPVSLESTWQLKNGVDVFIRPIRPEDSEIEREFIEGLSERSRYYRFMHNIKRVTSDMLARFTQIDYHRELALVALIKENQKWVEIGISRYVLNPDGKSCEFAVVVADQWQRSGVGYKLMELLLEAAKDRGLEFMDGIVLKENVGMRRLARNMGFEVQDDESDEDTVYIVKRL